MDPDQRDRLEELLESWFALLEVGETPDPAEHCAAHPELRDEFVRLLGRAEALDDLFAPRPRADDADEPPPDRLGEYELIAPIGQGGAGDVWLARQTSLRRLVALKLVKIADDPKIRRRLRREAEVAAALDHPGIVPIYAVGDEGTRAWIAMKWLTGPALDGVGAPLPPERAARIAASAARALHEAHEAGIIHRDVKPSNIVLDGDNPCLVDFGLARDGDDVTRTTADGHVSGTLLYMSPEQLRSGGSTATLDARTDVYSLGATLYELLAGWAPFEGDNPGKVIHQILDSEPPPLHVERDLKTIVLRALDKDRERRFPTALEMAEDLERYLAGQPILSRPVGLATRAWKLARRNRTATALLGAALFVAAGLGVSLGWTVYERARLLENGVARVREAIARNDLGPAEALLRQLLADDAEAPEVQAVQHELVACQGLEELLDRVQALPEDADPDELREAVAAIDAEALPPQRQLEFALAQPLALAICGDLKPARALADALPESRARDALRAAIAAAENDWQETGPWQLQTGKAPVDHLFAALAMRLAERPLKERRQEIEDGRALDATYPRLQLQEAIQLVNEQAHTAAYHALDGLDRDGDYPRIVRRLLLFEAIQLGEDGKARSHLRAFLEEHDRATWTAADAAYLLDACYWLDARNWRDRPVDVDDILNFARERWPRDRQVTVLAAREIGSQDPQAARELLAASVEMARSDVQAGASRLALMHAEALSLGPFVDPWNEVPTAENEARLRDLAQRAADLRAAAPSEELRRAAGVLEARALWSLGDITAAGAALDSLDQDAPEVALERAQQAVSHFDIAVKAHHGQADAWQLAALSRVREELEQNWHEHVRAARPRLSSAIDGLSPQRLFQGRTAAVEGWMLAAQLAIADRDEAAARAAVDAARPLLARDPDDPRLALLRYIEAQIPE